ILYARGRAGAVLDRAEGDNFAEIVLGLISEQDERDEPVALPATGEFLRDVALARDHGQDIVALAWEDMRERFEHILIFSGHGAVLGMAILPGTELVHDEDDAVVITELCD